MRRPIVVHFRGKGPHWASLPLLVKTVLTGLITLFQRKDLPSCRCNLLCSTYSIVFHAILLYANKYIHFQLLKYAWLPNYSKHCLELGGDESQRRGFDSLKRLEPYSFIVLILPSWAGMTRWSMCLRFYLLSCFGRRTCCRKATAHPVWPMTNRCATPLWAGSWLDRALSTRTWHVLASRNFRIQILRYLCR